MKPYALFPRTPGLFSSLNVQKNMLQDRVRNSALKEAIFRTVKQGDVVIDLGTGTGILAIWAAQAGASKVYAIEETDVAEVAEAVIRDNGLQDVITVLKANSAEVTLSAPADLLIAEVVGHFLFEEGIVEAIADVRGALLKTDARIIPQAARVFMAPVTLNEEFKEISYWDSWQDPRLAAVRNQAANCAYVETISTNDLLGDPVELFSVDFTTAHRARLEATASFSNQRSGSLDAFAGWFELDLGGDVLLGTGPGDEPTHWQQCIFPLATPFHFGPNDQIALRFSIEPFAPGSEWNWSLTRNGAAENYEEHALTITYSQDSRLIKERF